jgi:hypothetical protein
LIVEVRETLAEPYFRALLDQDEAEKAVSALQRVAVMYEDPVDPEPVLRDPDDDFCSHWPKPAKLKRSLLAIRTCSTMPTCGRPRSARAMLSAR